MKQLLLLFCSIPILSFAQQALKVSPDVKMVYSDFDKQFFVIDDSTHYYTFQPGQKFWKRHDVCIELDLNWTFEEFKQRFYPMAIGKQHYLFVLDGCGLVYELKNDTIKRIDQSYDQKNQFQSAVYAYNGQVYMFGGYGLFEVKNTHSYFDVNAKEWFQVYRNTKQCPPPRMSPYFIQMKKDLYVLGGVEKKFNYTKLYQDIWHYDLKTKKWQLLGELNPDFIRRTRIRGFVQNKDYQIFHSNNQMTLVDVAHNRYYSYMSGRYFPLSRIIPDANLNWVLTAHHNSNNGASNYLKVQKLKRILYGNPKEHFLYKPISIFKQIPYETYLWASILTNIFLFFLLFYIRRITKTAWYKPKNPILERKEFTELEWKVLLLIKENNELELSALNDYFDEPGLSYETLKKRRESFVRALRIKLALLTRRDVDQLLQESKHPLDKRMKIIRWDKDLEIKLEE